MATPAKPLSPRKRKVAAPAVAPRPNSRKRKSAAELAAIQAVKDAEALKASRVQVRAQFPAKLKGLRLPYRYKVLRGGRGGSKSWNVARELVLRCYSQPTRVLCAREFQNSITESVHKLLTDQIDRLGLNAWFVITQTSIKCVLHDGKSEFIFSGIRNNVTKIKSMEGIDVCWVEEAEKVSNESWEVLIPTIRKPGSEIWVTFNPHQETDPTYKRFIVNEPDDCLSVEINWRDNPWFPDELRREMEYLRRVDFDAYLHVWEGHCRNVSDAQILRGKVRVESFEPNAAGTGEWNGPYFGADWGFAQDPTTLVKLWINGRTLFVEYEAYGVAWTLTPRRPCSTSCQARASTLSAPTARAPRRSATCSATAITSAAAC
jgi:phage terminase large subunit